MSTVALRGCLVFAVAAGVSGCGSGAASTNVENEPSKGSDASTVRSFRFDYGATVSGIEAGKKVRVWLPLPTSDDHQTVREVLRKLPAEAGDSIQENVEPENGNTILYFEMTAPASGTIDLDMAWDVERREAAGLKKPDGSPKPLTDEQRAKFVAANRRVPVGHAKPLGLIARAKLPEDPLDLGKALYDTVDEHMRYDKPADTPGWGNGDSVWACDSGFGNCTDFHSLFISLARSQGLPARFEIGFPLPAKTGDGPSEGPVGGYHCWAYFHVADHGWVPVDISEADKDPTLKTYYFGNLTANRIAFTNGRDIQLVPRQEGEPLNYFVYPYIEVDGKPLSGDQIKPRFAYKGNCGMKMGGTTTGTRQWTIFAPAFGVNKG